MTEEQTTSQIIFLDDDGNPTTREKATAARILEYDATGERIMETYLDRVPDDAGEEVTP